MGEEICHRKSQQTRRAPLAIDVIILGATNIGKKVRPVYVKVSLGAACMTSARMAGPNPLWDFTASFEYTGQDYVCVEVLQCGSLGNRVIGFAQKPILEVVYDWHGDMLLFTDKSMKENARGSLQVSFSWPAGIMSHNLVSTILQSKSGDESLTALLSKTSLTKSNLLRLQPSDAVSYPSVSTRVSSPSISSPRLLATPPQRLKKQATFPLDHSLSPTRSLRSFSCPLDVCLPRDFEPRQPIQRNLPVKVKTKLGDEDELAVFGSGTLIKMKKLAVQRNDTRLATRIRQCELRRIKQSVDMKRWGSIESVSSKRYTL